MSQLLLRLENNWYLSVQGFHCQGPCFLTLSADRGRCAAAPTGNDWTAVTRTKLAFGAQKTWKQKMK